MLVVELVARIELDAVRKDAPINSRRDAVENKITNVIWPKKHRAVPIEH